MSLDPNDEVQIATAYTNGATSGSADGFTISGFGSTDEILDDGIITSVTFSQTSDLSGILTLYDSLAVVGSLVLKGNYNDATFNVFSQNEITETQPNDVTVSSGHSVTLSSGTEVGNVTLFGGEIELASGATIGGQISFASTGGALVIEPASGGTTEIPNNTIIGFSAGDTIQLAGVPYSATEDSFTVATAGTLTIDANGTIYNLDLAGVTIGQSNFSLSGDLTLTEAANPVCFVLGTQLKTPGGEAAVEDLRPGDMVMTPTGAMPVRWVGHRAYDGRLISGNHLALPVCIRAGALGTNVPMLDLHVSPGHGIWLYGVLVPAWRLVNGVSITQTEAVETVEYFNVELEGHGLLFAHGAPVESFLDDGAFRNRFQNVAEYWALYPDTPVCRDVIALPRVESGFKLASIQALINQRAGIASYTSKTGPLRGYLDVVGSNGVVSGWAQDILAPETPIALNVMVGGHIIAHILANAYRTDLREAGLGSGCHGFEFHLPPGCVGDIEVKRALDGTSLVSTTRPRAKAA
jgi:hypothetical protein